MFKVFFFSLAIDQYVIKIYNDTFVKQRSENIIHQCHKCGWGIGKSKGENTEFKVSILDSKGGLWNVLVLNSDLVIT